MGREIICGSGAWVCARCMQDAVQIVGKGRGRWLQLSVACCMLNPMEPARDQELGRCTRRVLAWWH